MEPPTNRLVCLPRDILEEVLKYVATSRNVYIVYSYSAKKRYDTNGIKYSVDFTRDEIINTHFTLEEALKTLQGQPKCYHTFYFIDEHIIGEGRSWITYFKSKELVKFTNDRALNIGAELALLRAGFITSFQTRYPYRILEIASPPFDV
jgi:hypothetical protein